MRRTRRCGSSPRSTETSSAGRRCRRTRTGGATAASRGKGVGRKLLSALIERAEAEGYWTLLAGVFPENEASLALHTALGFRVVGRHEGLGERDGVWRDVVLLEYRSTTSR